MALCRQLHPGEERLGGKCVVCFIRDFSLRNTGVGGKNYTSGNCFYLFGFVTFSEVVIYKLKIAIQASRLAKTK